MDLLRCRWIQATTSRIKTHLDRTESVCFSLDFKVDRLLIANFTDMAPVSPWFFTHLSTSTDFQNTGKNWLFVSEDLLFTRWEQILAFDNRPQIVELVTWNDYGESHYLGPMKRKYAADVSVLVSCMLIQLLTMNLALGRWLKHF